MDKDNNKKIRNTDLKTWHNFGVLRSDAHLEFVFKKTEKISAALYLITSLIKDNDPIRLELREKAIALVNAGITLTHEDPFDHRIIFSDIAVLLFEINSILRVACFAEIVSRMNYEVINSEILNVVTLLGEKNKNEISTVGYVLSDTFFETDTIVSEPAIKKNETTSLAGQVLEKSPLKNDHKIAQKNVVSEPLDIDKGHKKPLENIASIKDKKNSRKMVIINLLKKDSNLTIKDFIKVIPECSEKTIQRELLDLVGKGVLKKEGERRWSTYSLRD